MLDRSYDCQDNTYVNRLHQNKKRHKSEEKEQNNNNKNNNKNDPESWGIFSHDNGS